MDLSPSEADRLPELVERSIMNAFAGLDEEDEAPLPEARPAKRHGRGEDADHSAAMASIADALAREFSPAPERAAARSGGWQSRVLSEPGLEEDTIDEFDDVRGTADGGDARADDPRKAEPREAEAPRHAAPAREPDRQSRTAGERMASLRGRLEPRFGDHRGPAPAPQVEAAPSPALAPRREAPETRDTPAPEAKAPPRERLQPEPLAHASPAQGDQRPAPKEETVAPPSVAHAPAVQKPAEGNVFRRPAGERRTERPEKADDALTSTATRESIELALEELSRTVIPQNARTLEDLVRDMMRPLLREWLEANLAKIVERTVRQEIERVAARRY